MSLKIILHWVVKQMIQKFGLIPDLSCLMTKPAKWLCTQRRLRSAWASAQSVQSLHYAFSGKLRIQPFFMRTAKTDQTGRMPRLIWVFTGRTATLLGLSWGGSFLHEKKQQVLYSLSLILTVVIFHVLLMIKMHFRPAIKIFMPESRQFIKMSGWTSYHINDSNIKSSSK